MTPDDIGAVLCYTVAAAIPFAVLAHIAWRTLRQPVQPCDQSTLDKNEARRWIDEWEQGRSDDATRARVAARVRGEGA